MGFLLEKECFSDWDSELLTWVLTCVCVCQWECLVVMCFVWKGPLYMWSLLNSNSLSRLYFNDYWSSSHMLWRAKTHFILFSLPFKWSDPLYGVSWTVSTKSVAFNHYNHISALDKSHIYFYCTLSILF